MNIKDLYKDAIKERIKKICVLNNSIPGKIAFNKAVKSSLNKYNFIGSTTLIGNLEEFDNPRQGFNEQDLRRVLDYFYVDAVVIKKSLSKSEQQIIDLWSEWSTFYKSTLPRLRDLENRSVRLLLLEENSKGYLEFFKEEFLNLDYINEDESDVAVNTNEGFVFIEENELGAQKEKLFEQVTRVVVAGSNQLGEVTLSNLPGTSPNNLVSEDNRGWIGQVYTTSPQPCTCEVLFELKGTKAIQEIKLEPLYKEYKEGLVSMSYSTDGLNWIDSSTQHSISDPWIWLIEKAYVKKIKFFITKEHFDTTGHNGDYYYLFNLKGLAIYSKGSSLFRKDSATLVSKLIEVGDFRKVSIEACSINTEDTNVDFYVSVGNDWVSINPLNQAPNEKPKVVSFDSTRTKSNLSSLSGDLINPSLPGTSLLNPQDVGFGELNRQGIFVLNHKIQENIILANQLNEINLLGDYTTQPSLEKIKGWSVSNKLSTYIYIDSQEPLVFNLNEGSIRVNKQEKFGNVIIPANELVLIECDLNQYSFTQFNANSEAILSELDVLYPNNIKHLIEGYPYPSGFSGRRVYQGTTYRAARKYQPVNNFNDFVNQVNTYYLSYNRNDSCYYVFVNAYMDLEELSNQKYFLEYNFSPTTFNSIKLKAELKTRNMTISPIVTNYTIKLGY